MSDKQAMDVTAHYAKATEAGQKFQVGYVPDLEAQQRAAFIHGYARALMDTKWNPAELSRTKEQTK